MTNCNGKKSEKYVWLINDVPNELWALSAQPQLLSWRGRRRKKPRVEVHSGARTHASINQIRRRGLWEIRVHAKLAGVALRAQVATRREYLDYQSPCTYIRIVKSFTTRLIYMTSSINAKGENFHSMFETITELVGRGATRFSHFWSPPTARWRTF